MSIQQSAVSDFDFVQRLQDTVYTDHVHPKAIAQQCGVTEQKVWGWTLSGTNLPPAHNRQSVLDKIRSITA